jgi:hypothetical protein
MHSLLSIVVLMSLACTAAASTTAPTPLSTPNVPLLDEETVSGLVLAHVTGQSHLCGKAYLESIGFGQVPHLDTQYVGRDIWVVNIEAPMCI